VPRAGGANVVSVMVTTTDDNGWDFSQEAIPSWITPSVTSGPWGKTAVSFTIQANSTSQARSANIWGDRLVIAQVGTGNPTLTLSKSSQTVPAGTDFLISNNASTKVTTNYPFWFASTTSPFLTVTGDGYGVSGESVVVGVGRNPASAARSGTVTVRAGSITKTFTVNQSAGSITLGTSSWAAPAAGGSKSTAITVKGPEYWSAASNAEWLSIPEAEGHSPGSLLMFADPNPTKTSRTAVVTITAGDMTKEYKVTQSGAAWLNPAVPEWKVGFEAADVKIPVMTNQGTWTASTTATWVSLPVKTGATGQEVTIQVKANASSRRTATMTLKAGSVTKSFTITQSGKGYINLPITSWQPDGGGDQIDVPVTSKSTWTAKTSADWVDIEPTTGPNGATATLYASQNWTGRARYAVVTFTSTSAASIIISQPGQG
jgi:hypothetical protein